METLLCLRDHSRLLLQLGDGAAAVLVASAAGAGLALMGAPQTPSANRRWQDELAALEAALPDPAAFKAAWAEGQEIGLEAAARRALVTTGKLELAA